MVRRVDFSRGVVMTNVMFYVATMWLHLSNMPRKADFLRLVVAIFVATICGYIVAPFRCVVCV